MIPGTRASLVCRRSDLVALLVRKVFLATMGAADAVATQVRRAEAVPVHVASMAARANRAAASELDSKATMDCQEFPGVRACEEREGIPDGTEPREPQDDL